MRKLSLCWRSGSGTSGEESERSSSSSSGFPGFTTEERAASAEKTYRGIFILLILHPSQVKQVTHWAFKQLSCLVPLEFFMKFHFLGICFCSLYFSGIYSFKVCISEMYYVKKICPLVLFGVSVTTRKHFLRAIIFSN